jgi:hypothetical protein
VEDSGVFGSWHPSDKRMLTAFPGAFSSTKVRTARMVRSSSGEDGLRTVTESQALQRLFLFPRWCLLAPSRAGKAHRRDLASYITRLCNEFQSLTPGKTAKARSRKGKAQNHPSAEGIPRGGGGGKRRYPYKMAPTISRRIIKIIYENICIFGGEVLERGKIINREK